METLIPYSKGDFDQLTDDQLVAQSVSAQQAFGELVTRYYSRVYAAAYAYTGQHETAEEVAQEAFLRAYLRLDTLQQTAAFGGWVTRIARNLAHNWNSQVQVRNKLAVMVPLDDGVFELEDAATPSPRESVAARENKEIVQRALLKLDAPDRELVLLHFIDDVSQSEIARQLGVYPSTVGRRLGKALAVLREDLGTFFTGAGSALAPAKAGPRRVTMLIAAAATLPVTSKAVLAAAAAGLPGMAVSAALPAELAATESASFFTTYGGKIMATTKAVAIGIMGFCLMKAALPETSAAEPVGAVDTMSLSIDLRGINHSHISPGSGSGSEIAIASPASPTLSNTSARPTVPFWQLATVEAEKCKITSPDYRIEPEEWACGSQHVAFWGDQGDAIEWQVSVPEVLTDAQIGIRYSYHADDYMRKTNSPAEDHVAHLYIDEQGPIILKFSDTQGWNWYSIATAELPLLAAGTHAFRVTVPLNFQAANIDALSLFRGDIAVAPAGPLRPSVLATSDEQKIFVLASPNAVLVEDAEGIAAVYHQLLSLMEEDFGRDLQHPVYVHFVEPRRWDPRNGRAIRNQHGIYLLADDQSERAEWCWVLAEYMADPEVPRWFRESICRTNGLLDWLPSLDSSTTTKEDVLAAALVAEADKFLDDPTTTCSRVEVVHAAVRARYGNDVFKKFWQGVAKRKAQHTEGNGSVTRVLSPADIMDKNVLIQVLSEAAGEDVAPLYRRWTGFAGELPIDPVTVSDELAQR